MRLTAQRLRAQRATPLYLTDSPVGAHTGNLLPKKRSSEGTTTDLFLSAFYSFSTRLKKGLACSPLKSIPIFSFCILTVSKLITNSIIFIYVFETTAIFFNNISIIIFLILSLDISKIHGILRLYKNKRRFKNDKRNTDRKIQRKPIH